ncbi:MAG: hypothetical protein GY863_15200, partial [bacterium]|nr:hypothetical protein [bacterium]
MKLRLSVILSLLLLNFCNLFAQIDKNITYQGILKNNDGSVVTDDDYSITFKLYEGESGGTEIWTETQTIATSNGLFSVYLGIVTELN